MSYRSRTGLMIRELCSYCSPAYDRHRLIYLADTIDSFGRNPPYYNRALLYYTDGKIIMNFSRRLLTGHTLLEPRSPNIPNLTEAQAEALDAVHFIAIKNQKKLSMEEGDMRFINNMGLLHGRDAFFDHDGSKLSKRHLLRLWLHNEDKMWKLPSALQIAWDRVFADNERVGRWDVERYNPDPNPNPDPSPNPGPHPRPDRPDPGRPPPVPPRGRSPCD